MLFRGAILAASLLIPSPVAPATIQQEPIPKVVCPKLGGEVSGTAFRIGAHLLLTAKHVSAEAPCEIDGRAMHVEYSSPNSDFAELSDERSGPFLKVDCGGFVKGREYLALGYARGLDFVYSVLLVATGIMHNNGMAILWGVVTIIPGQSGGPVLDKETGAVVGIANASNFQMGLSLSVQLKDTPICRKDIA